MPREKLNPPPPAAGHGKSLDTVIGTLPEFEVRAPDQPPPPGHALHRVRSIRVMWGDETIQPVQYNVFHVGSIEMEVTVNPGEDPAAVHASAYAALEQMGAEQYRLKRDAFLSRLADTAQVVRARAKNPTR